MRNLWSIAKRELGAFFASPIAYIVVAVFLFLGGSFFYGRVQIYELYSRQMMSYGYGQAPNVNQELFLYFFSFSLLVLIFVVPLLTMRLFSEEKKTGTEELLLTSPLSVVQIVGGKFLATLLLYAVLLLGSAVIVLFGFLFGNPEVMPVLSGFLGLLLVGAAFISVGMLFSSLTENQVISAVLSIGSLLLLYFIYYETYFSTGAVKAVIGAVSFTPRFENMIQGNVDTADLAYFLSFTFFGLFLTQAVIQSRRWR